MLGCEQGAEGCLGRLLDPLTSGRVGGATQVDVKNTQVNEKIGGKCQGTEVSSGVDSFHFQAYTFRKSEHPPTQQAGFFFLYAICCCLLDKHFISYSKYIIISLLGSLDHLIFYIS